ncbi:MAG: TlpA family protein disulfide reductase [Bdellovibrionales bacterium]
MVWLETPIHGYNSVMWSFKGLLAVFITGAILSIPLYYYWEYLTRGMRPPQATRILDELEKRGVPEFQVEKLDGGSVSPKDFKGRILLVNIWATWCAPCVKEFPSLQNLVREFKGELTVLAISYDKDRADIETFIKAFGGVPENFVVAWDKDRVTSKLFGTDVLPETYIFSQDQKLVRKVAGETTWDDPYAFQFFRKILK